MFQPQLINTVLVWERILEIEEEKRKMNRFEDVLTADGTDLKPNRKESKDLASWFSRSEDNGQTTYSCCAQEPCQETR
jgi:hypothetical protein